MKIAMTVWEGWISPVFDVCRQGLILEIDGKNTVSAVDIDLETITPLQKIEKLRGHEIDTLICGAISKPIYWKARSRGLKVISFVTGEVDEVIQAFVAGKLPTPTLTMPGHSPAGTTNRGNKNVE